MQERIDARTHSSEFNVIENKLDVNKPDVIGSGIVAGPLRSNGLIEFIVIQRKTRCYAATERKVETWTSCPFRTS